MYMDVIKLLAKNEKELENLKQSVRIYSYDIGMELALEKCAMLIMKSEKRHRMKGIEFLSQEKIRMLGEKETYMKRTRLHMQKWKKKEYLWRMRKLLETKLHSRNLIIRKIPGLYPS